MNRFRIRNRRYEIEEDLSAKEILRRIAAGKLAGEDEVSVPPHESWEPLSSHPAFYDAFLKKLYADQYHSPDTNNPSATPASQKGSSESPGAKPSEPPKTRLDSQEAAVPPGMRPMDEGAGGKKERGVTVHQDSIDGLFSDVGEKRGGDTERLPSDADAGTALVKVEPGAAPLFEATVKLNVPISPADQAPEELVSKRRTQQLFRRGRVAAIVVALVLLILFKWGGGETGTKSNASSDGEPLVRQLIETGVSKSEKAKSLMNEAVAIADNDAPAFYLSARDILAQARALDDSNPYLLGKVASVDARLLPDHSDPDALLEDIQQAIQRGRMTEPHLSAFYRCEALVGLFQKKYDIAKEAITHAIEADPGDAENSLVLSEIQTAMGENESALISASEAVRLGSQSVRARSQLARLSLEQGDIAKARNEALEALKLNPLHAASYYVMAEVSRIQNQLDEAKGLYETSGKLARFQSMESAARDYFRLGTLLESFADVAGAKKAYRLAYYYLPNVDRSLEGKLKGQDTSRKGLESLARETEYGTLYFEEQAEGLMEQGKINEALRFLQAANVLSPNDGLILIRMGEAFEKVAASYDDFRRVTNLYERAIERDPKQPKGYIRLGLLETEQYNLDRGYKLLKQAAALSPDDAQVYIAMGKHYYKRQDFNEALQQFLKAAKVAPDDSEVMYYAGLLRIAIKHGAAKDAMPFFFQAYSVDPENYDALVEWLKLKVDTFDKNQAIRFVNGLLQKEPNNSNLYWALGEVYAANKEYRRAITYYHKSLDLNNKVSKVRMSLASALRSVGELERSVAEYRLASLLDRRNSDGFFNAADILFSAKNYVQAEEVLKYLLSVTPNYPGALRYLSKIYALRGQEKESIEAMRKEVANNPDNYKFVTELAELLMSYKKYDDAITQLKRVTNLPAEFTQDKIRGYLLLSRCYLKMERATNAESAIKLALKLDANDPELHKELGYVYYGEQRDKEGAREFQLYLSRNPAAQDAEAIKNLIKHMIIEE